MRSALPAKFWLILTLGLGIFLFGPWNVLQIVASTANHIVISEIQLAGETSHDEFVELYNPTENDININGWKLSKKTASGTQANLVTSFADITIPSNHYFLIVHPEYFGTTPSDVSFSTAGTISSNNTILLFNDEGELIDKVGLGTAGDFETQTTNSPATGQSVARKANLTSTSESMASGGADEFAGNGYDTDNNFNDFVLRTTVDPQNLASAPEPRTSEPSPTPTNEPSPTPTLEPSPTPTEEPSPTPTLEPTPTSIPTPTPLAGKITQFEKIGITCALQKQTITFGNFKLKTPRFFCFYNNGRVLFGK